MLLQKGSDEAAAAAEDCFGWAGEVAREQGALFWELQVALSLARSRVTQDRHDEARDILTPVYNWFTEGCRTSQPRGPVEPNRPHRSRLYPKRMRQLPSTRRLCTLSLKPL